MSVKFQNFNDALHIFSRRLDVQVIHVKTEERVFQITKMINTTVFAPKAIPIFIARRVSKKYCCDLVEIIICNCFLTKRHDTRIVSFCSAGIFLIFYILFPFFVYI